MITQVRKLADRGQLLHHLTDLGVELPVAEEVEADGALAAPVEIRDGEAAPLTSPNRFAVLPMEGWDGTSDGRPTDLVRRRWERFAGSGAGLVWGEATAVRHDGRANPNQLLLNETTVDDIAGLRAQLDPAQVTGLQLTHSGRFSRPDGDAAPLTAYEHPILDERVGAGADNVLSDNQLDELVDAFAAAARLAQQAGFDFVDIKACHGYLGHELLSAYDRPGRYGGDLAGRTNFLRSVVAAVRDRAPGLALALRLSIFDLVPYEAGEDGIGQPTTGRSGGAVGHHPFGADDSGLGVDLNETHELLDLVEGLGIGLVCASAGSPYYNPHVQRPAYFPPSDGYLPPEDPLVGVARLIGATAEVAARHPALVIIASGYSYLQEWLAHVGQAVVAGGGASMVGLGRMVLSYPELPADVLAGRPLQRRLICRTFSDCTTAPRHGLVSGCYPLDPLYKQRPERVELTKAKQAAKNRRVH